MKWGPAEKVCNYRIKNHLISVFSHKEANLRLSGNILILTCSNLNIYLHNVRDKINSTGLYEVLCTAKNFQVAECRPTSLVNTHGLMPLNDWAESTKTEQVD